MSHYKVLGLARGATDADIRTAYRKRALQCHPDKPGGSKELFNQLQSAYDTLKDIRKRKKYDEELAETRRRRAFRPPPPLSSVRMPETFVLPDGSKYAFETAPDRLRCKFRHGDVVRHTDGEQGVFIGVAGDGLFYWCPMNQSFAVPLNTFGGEQDITVLYRQVVSKRPASGGATASASSSHADPTGRAGGDRRTNADDASAKRREMEEERLRQQRQRRLQISLNRIATEETARRDALERAVERYWDQAASEHRHGMEHIRRRYEAEESPSSPALRRPSQSASSPKRSSASPPRPGPAQRRTAAASPAPAYRSVKPRSTTPAANRTASRPSMRSTAARDVSDRMRPTGANPLSPPAPAATGSNLAPLDLNAVNTAPPATSSNQSSPTNQPQEAPRRRAPSEQRKQPAVPQSPTTARGSSTVRSGSAARPSTARASTPTVQQRVASPRPPRSATPRQTSTPILHSVRVNNSFLKRRDNSGSYCAPLDDEQQSEYDALVVEAMKRQQTPRRTATPTAGRRTATPRPAFERSTSGQKPNAPEPESRPSGRRTTSAAPRMPASVPVKLRSTPVRVRKTATPDTDL